MKSKTPMSLILPAMGLWSIPLAFLVAMQYITNATAKTFSITVIYPMIIALMSRNARFWVTKSAIGFAGVFTMILISLLLIDKKNKDALSKPVEHKERSALLYTAVVACFVLGIAFTGIFVEELYRPDEFRMAVSNVNKAAGAVARSAGNIPLTNFAR
jgi:membrane protein CcdC involved in cytochrome C biogenesis